MTLKGINSTTYWIAMLQGVLLMMVSVGVNASYSKDLECVQKQLTKLAEREAMIQHDELAGVYHDIRLQNAYLRLPEELTKENAVIACRLFGQEFSPLLAYWPGMKKRFEVFSRTNVNPKLISQIKDMLIKVWSKNLSVNGVRFVRTVPVVVGTSIADLEPFAKQRMGEFFNQKVFDEVAQYSCQTHLDMVSGFVLGHTVYLCFEDQNITFMQEHLRWFDKAVTDEHERVEYMLVHELFHVYQREVIGYDKFYDSLDPIDEVVVLPAWLVEGTASMAGYYAYNENFELPDEELNKLLQLVTEPMHEMESVESYERHAEKLYEQGVVASVVLIQDHGKHLIDRLFANVGQGDAWQVAFEKNFDMKPEVFYQGIEKQ